MVWARFTSEFRFKPKPVVTIVYRVGQVRNVTRECFRKAEEKGVAVAASRAKNPSNPRSADKT